MSLRVLGALPDRLYLIGRGGHVAFQGDPGPWGFDPTELERASGSSTERQGFEGVFDG